MKVLDTYTKTLPHALEPGQAFLIRTDGSVQAVAPETGKKFGLDELQGAVGGYIEHVRMGPRTSMIVNEEGKLRGLEFNSVATLLFAAIHGQGHDLIVGNVIYCAGGML